MIATRPFVDRVGADDSPDAARLVHHPLVGRGVHIVLVEPQQVELLGWLFLWRHLFGETGMTLLLATAFVNPDGQLATVVMNPTDKEITYNFYVGQASAMVTIPARAIQTLVN